MNDELTAALIGICRQFGTYERDAICCGTVTVSQCVVLQSLLERSQILSELAAASGVSGSAMTRLVDGLERRGWTTRVRSTEDRRRVDVQLTDAGRAEAERLRDATKQAVALVMSRVPKAKHAAILEAMQLVGAAMESARAQLDGGCC